MVELFNFPKKWYQGSKIAFSRFELNQILSIYGMRVSRGEWRDYAIDSTTNTAMFSIFKNANEKPLYIIIKTVDRGFKKNTKFIIYTEGKALIKGNTILEVLQIFKQVNKKGK